ncbi:PilZ domain-containing protein [Thalassolituus marinus]|uniref:PilZ domain-containing protein n=1 Tax=Thalassolituus marinus TaxID=671053 RepID=A0ABS7ZKY2_9GAMM|nr:PilZ domain-containing protein [Thalassolituus marinus]MCA6062384.1 PilZ domain-containing protein [Thalassolituus marinus]
MTSPARSYNEKRNFIRMQVSAPAVLTLTDGQTVELTCLDISSSGVQLQHFEPLQTDISGRLTVSSGGGYTSPLEADVTICRVQQSGTDEYRIGVTIDSFL